MSIQAFLGNIITRFVGNKSFLYFYESFISICRILLINMKITNKNKRIFENLAKITKLVCAIFLAEFIIKKKFSNEKEFNNNHRFFHILESLKIILCFYIKQIFFCEKKYENYTPSRVLEFTIERNKNLRKCNSQYSFKNVDFELESEDAYFDDDISEDEDLDDITNRHNALF